MSVNSVQCLVHAYGSYHNSPPREDVAQADKGIFGINAKWYGEWWHSLLFFLCFGFIWMRF